MGKLLYKKLHPHAIGPKAAHEGEDLCYDLYAAEDVFLKPFRQATIPTGIAAVYIGRPYTPWLRKVLNFFGLLPQYGLEIKDRSGLASKYGVHHLAGEVDAGWRGDIGVVHILLGPPVDDYPGGLSGGPVGYRIFRGDKIAQMRPVRIRTGKSEEVDDLPPGKRGLAGWGSTGK